MNTSNPDREHSPDIEDALKAHLQSPAPNEAFVDRLEQQLRDRSAALSERGLDRRSSLRSRLKPLRRFDLLWQRSRTAAFNLVALAALLILVVGLMALFGKVKPSTTTPVTPTPAGPMLVLQGSIAEASGPIGQREIPVSVRAALPQVPDRVPLYNIKSAFDKPSAELARGWAEKLGLKAVRLYQDTTMPDVTYVAQGDDGRSVRVGPGAQLMYQANLESLFVPAPSSAALDPRAAQAAAEAFLNSVPDLFVVEGSPAARITFRVEPSPHQSPEARVFGMTFEYTAMIDGLPVLSRGTPGTIMVDTDGQIRSAMLTPLRVTPTGNEVAVQPANAVVQSFLDGDQSVSRGSGWSSAPTGSDAQPQSIHTREPVYTVGDNVTLKGGFQHWVAIDGGADLYFLPSIGAQSFILEGEGLTVSSLSVEITGRIAGQVRSGAWRIAVTSVRPIEADPQAYTDWIGTLRRQADGTWLETDNGQKYLLPDPPADLPDGARVEAPGAVIDNGDGITRLEWQLIYALPQSAAAGSASSAASSGGGGVAVAATVVAPIEPTQVVTAAEETPTSGAVLPVYPNGAPYSTGVFQSVTSGTSGPTITPTLPAWWTYKPGDDVTLEGQLSAQGYRILSAVPSDPSATPAPGRTVFEAHLLVMKDEDKPDEMVPITLVGDQVNLDLIRLNGLHVRVQGRLLAGDEAAKRYPNLIDKGLTGLALEVTRFEKARPDETKDVYSGQIRMETFEGQEAAIFSDTLSGKEYVLADSLTITYTLEMYRQQAQKGETLYAIGVIVADKAFAGRPILRLLETRSSTGNPEEVIRVMRAELDNPIQDVGLVNEGPQDVIIDRVELAYVFQPPPLRAPEGFASSPTELVYELTGHSSDGRFTVTYDLEATSPTTPAMLRPTLSSMPTPTKSDLGKLVYVQVGDIWVKSLPDGQPQRLTTDGHNHEPRWSPSGQWLAFRGSDSRMWLIRADGSAKHSLSEGNPVKDFTWAPNVDRLAYTLDDGALSVVGADGSDRQAFVMPNSRQPITGVESLAWSPDGQWLAFARFEILTEGAPPDRYDSVWRIRADGGEAAELLNAGRPSDREFILAGWSSDSSTILLWINPGYSSSILADGVRLYALPIKGGSTLQLAAELETGAVPQEETVLYHSDFIAPARANFDASQIALTVGGYRATWENKRIGIADVPTGKIRLLTPKDQSAFSPDWSPDGTHLAYVAMPDKGDLVGGEDARLGMMSRRIYIVNTQGDPPSKPLTNDPAYRDEHPLWSADGSFILFARMNHENRASVWLVSAEGGEPQRIVDELTPAPEWFGYYGYIDWNDLFDWSRGPTH